MQGVLERILEVANNFEGLKPRGVLLAEVVVRLLDRLQAEERKKGKRMDLEKIKEVTEDPTKEKANNLLGEGWILLDAKVVKLGNIEGDMKGGGHYILGRR